MEALVATDVDLGIMETCSGSNYVAEPVLVRKKSGDWCLTMDYRRINSKMRLDGYPLPRPVDIFDSLYGMKVFSKLDAWRGYHQLKVNPEDRHKTAFRTSKGLYQYKRMPMGMKNSGAAFQRKMEIVLRGLLGKICEVYLDDILVFSGDFKQHLIDLAKVLRRL